MNTDVDRILIQTSPNALKNRTVFHGHWIDTVIMLISAQ